MLPWKYLSNIFQQVYPCCLWNKLFLLFDFYFFRSQNDMALLDASPNHHLLSYKMDLGLDYTQIGFRSESTL